MAKHRQVHIRVLVPRNQPITLKRGSKRFDLDPGLSTTNPIRLPPDPGDPGSSGVVLAFVHFGADADLAAVKNKGDPSRLSARGPLIDLAEFGEVISKAGKSGATLELHVIDEKD